MSAPTFDDALSLRLNDVPLPAGLLAGLRSIPLREDADLDRALAGVPVPATLMPRLATIANGRRHWRAPLPRAAAAFLPQAAVYLLPQAAAALFVFAASLGYALSAVAFVRGRFEEHPAVVSQLASLVSVVEHDAARLDPGPTTLEPPAIEIAFPTLKDDNVLAAFDVAPPSRSTTAKLDVVEQAMAGNFGGSPFWLLPAGGRFYEFETIERAAVRLANPWTLDLVFWRRTGILPWLSVEENRGIKLPLVQSDRSYRLARQRIQSGRLPAAAEIRCEEFIAGIDYGIGLEGRAEPLYLAAAPSPLDQLGSGAMVGAEMNRRWLLMAATTRDEDTQGQDLDARLDLEFSREFVAAYRLIGYSPPASTSDDVKQGYDEGERAPARRNAVLLFEIELQPGYQRNDELVRVTLEETGDDAAPHVRTDRATLRAETFWPDFDSAPVIWRQAALVALAAERLAESPYGEVSLGEIAALAREIESLVYDRAGWQEFIVMLVRAQSLQGSLLREF